MFSSSHFHKIYSLSVTEGSLSLSLITFFICERFEKRNLSFSEQLITNTFLFFTTKQLSFPSSFLFPFSHSLHLLPVLQIAIILPCNDIPCPGYLLCHFFARREHFFIPLFFLPSLSLFLSFPFPTIAHSLTLRFRLLQSLFSCHHLLDQRNPPSRAREVRRSTEIVSKCHSIPSPTCNGPFKQWNRSGSFG